MIRYAQIPAGPRRGSIGNQSRFRRVSAREKAWKGERQRGRRVALFWLLAGLLVLCHGCHGDEDNELYASAGAVEAHGATRREADPWVRRTRLLLRAAALP